MKNREPVTNAQIALIVAAGAGALAWVFLGGAFEPDSQDCYDWAVQAGESESSATFVCEWAQGSGYDTSDITEAEFESTWVIAVLDIEGTLYDIYGALEESDSDY